MFQGSLVALVTPFTADGAVDFDALSELVSWHLASGSDGLVVLGTTGESPTITQSERKAIVNAVVAQVDGRIPVVVGTGTNDTQQSIVLTQQAKECGADGALVVTPYYNKPPQRALLAHYQAVSNVGLPVILYNVPGRTGVDLLPETVAQIEQCCPNVVALKEATGDVARVEALLALGTRLRLLSGDDLTASAFMQAGGHGVISVTANVSPHWMAMLCLAIKDKNIERAKTIDERLQSLHRALFVESNPIPVKWVLARLGKIKNTFRLPLVPLAPAYEQVLLACMHDLGLIEGENKTCQ
jgi:4-hydroxy-tetrahydrodipicolinate synthase